MISLTKPKKTLRQILNKSINYEHPPTTHDQLYREKDNEVWTMFNWQALLYTH